MGSIIMVVAVLLIHMLKKAVANEKPSSNRLGCLPVRLKIQWAIAV